jgi:D-galactarolactone cycloisomerase
MQITAVETVILRSSMGQAFFSSQGRFSERNSLLVRVSTDTGLVGWGEGGQYGPPEPVKACIDVVLGPMLVGADPRTPAVHWERGYTRIRDFGTKGPFIEALSALDIALWDLAGKAYGQPASTLLGGAFRTSIPAYGTGFYYDGEHPTVIDEGALRDECAKMAATGYRAVKVKIGLLSIAEDLRRIAVVRDAMGDDTVLLVDCNHSYNFAAARAMAAGMAELGVQWFEEPVVPEDKDAYRRLRETSLVPVAGGEAEYTRFGFYELITGGCVDIAQPDLCVAGGMSEWIKIQSIASAAGVSVVPHVWGSGIALAAAVQVIAATPANPFTANPIAILNEPVLEFDTTENPLRTDLLATPFRMTEGRVSVPDGPGLGVEVDEDVLNRFADTALS